MIVLDTSAACEMVRGTTVGNALKLLIENEEKVVSCDLLRAETANVFRRLVAFKDIALQDAQAYYVNTLNLVDEYVSLEDLQAEAFSESIRLHHSTYDMFYFVLARRRNATLFTIDSKLSALCEKHGVSCVQTIV